MKIETLGEWNGVLTGCGCCAMPAVNAPVKICESLRGYGYLAGMSPSCIWFPAECESYNANYYSEEGMQYATLRNEYFEEHLVPGWTQTTRSSILRANVGGVDVFPETPITDNYTFSDPFPAGAYHEIASGGGMSTAAARPIVKAAIVAAIDFDNADFTEKGADCVSRYYERHPIQFEIGTTRESFSCVGMFYTRYRWRVPVTHLGKYFKITWDIVTELVPGEPTLETDLTWEWTGPGNTEDAADASWLSPWYDLDPPETPGTRRIVNIRYVGYRSARFGSNPQLMGEGYELAAARETYRSGVTLPDSPPP